VLGSATVTSGANGLFLHSLAAWLSGSGEFLLTSNAECYLRTHSGMGTKVTSLGPHWRPWCVASHPDTKSLELAAGNLAPEEDPERIDIRCRAEGAHRNIVR
jgi:hypothetical protein